MSFWNKKKNEFDYGLKLLEFNGFENQPWTLDEAVKGTQIFGATGSGKSSGSGKEIAKAFLKAGFGGLVLCAKPDERKTWERYAEMMGRKEDLVVFSNVADLYFNPLAYEEGRDKNQGGGETLNLVELIMRLYELTQNYSAQNGGGGDDEKFWTNALKRCLSRMIDLLKLAEEEVSIENLRKLLSNALNEEQAREYEELLTDIQETEEFGQEAEKQNDPEGLQIAQVKYEGYITTYDKLTNDNYCVLCLRVASYNASQKSDKTTSSDYFLVKTYFLKEYAKLPEKTRSIIQEYFMGIVEPFMKGILKDHFSEGVHPDLYPEQTYINGKIIILDFSVKQYLLAGVLAQGIYKFIWQQAMERRDTDEYNLPVFLWVDESQYFINPDYDTLFQTTARSAGVCTVYLTQNINNYYFVMGGNQAQARAKSLLANLTTQIFHANSDFETNEWASKTIGQDYTKQRTRSENSEGITVSESFVKDYRVPPFQFTSLKTGGSKNSGVVESVIFINGVNWKNNGMNYIKTQFKQDKR